MDILSNGGFKAFFGDKDNKEVVMVLMNTLLPEHRKITKAEEKVEIARKMLDAGVPVEQIVQFTELDAEAIEKLRESR